MKKKNFLRKFFEKILFWTKSRFNEPSNKIIALLFCFILLLGFTTFLVESPKNPNIKNPFDALWWLVVTIASVGYGDIVPLSPFGRVLGIVTILTGVTFFTIISGTIASILIDIKIKDRKGLRKLNVKDHIVILGWNNHLEKVINSIEKSLDTDDFSLVLVNDVSEEIIEEIKAKYYNLHLKYVFGDITKEPILRRANIQDAQAVLILADISGAKKLDESDERTLMATLTVRSISSDVKVFAEVVKDDNAKYILKAGADEVILSGELNSFLLSYMIISPGMHVFIKELFIDDDNKLKLEAIPHYFIGKTFRDYLFFMREKSKGLPVAIMTVNKPMTIDDILSDNGIIDNFIKNKFAEADDDYFKDIDEDYNVKVNPDDSYVITENDAYGFIIY